MAETKQYTSLTVRFPPRLYEAIKRLAKEEHRSINGQIVFMIQNGTRFGGLGENGENIDKIIARIK